VIGLSYAKPTQQQMTCVRRLEQSTADISSAR